jgi:hypothetical protein
MQRYFQTSVHALIISAFFALCLTGRLDFPALIVFAIALGVSCYRAVKGMPPPLSSRGAFVLSCAYVFFFILDIAVVSGSFIPASIHLVLFLQIIKLYQEKTDKDYFYLIVLSFLQVLAASSLTIDMSFAVTLFLFLVALVSTLMSFDMHRSERKTKAELKGVAVPLGGMSLWATVWIIVTAIGLFLTIPRIGTGYFTRASVQALLVSGFTDSVQLGEIGQVKLSSAVVMHARQISGTPFAIVKWRGIALDLFDGHTWVKADRKRSPLYATGQGHYSIHPVVEPRHTAQYEFILEPLATSTLFGPHQVRSVSGRLQAIEYDSDDSIYLRFPTARRVQYQVTSEIPDRSPRPEVDEAIPGDISARYLQLPSEMDTRIAQLAATITAKGNSTFEKASLVESYLKRYYSYTLNLTWKPGPQPLSTFLFEAKTGHCEYFASSMAILLRSAGIPTRLVNGFLTGEYNPVSGDYIIRESDAHSWVEVYIPGRGWMEFDPTPADAKQGDLSLAMQFGHYIDAAEQLWNSYIIVYDMNAQVQLFRSAQDSVQSAQAAVINKSDRWLTIVERLSDRFAAGIRELTSTTAFWVVTPLQILAILMLKFRRPLYTRVQIWRLRRGEGVATEELIEQLFYRATQLAERKATARGPAETWREWIFGLPDPHPRTILKRALTVFEKAKYGRLPISPSDFACLEDAIRDLKGTT